MFRERQHDTFAPCGKRFYLNVDASDRVIPAHVRLCPKCKAKKRENDGKIQADVKTHPTEHRWSKLAKQDPQPQNNPITQIIDQEFFNEHSLPTKTH